MQTASLSPRPGPITQALARFKCSRTVGSALSSMFPLSVALSGVTTVPSAFIATMVCMLSGTISRVRPAPLLSHAFDASVGAPEYSDEPPMINALPKLYLWYFRFRFGRTMSDGSVRLMGYDWSRPSTGSENRSPYSFPVSVFIPVSSSSHAFTHFIESMMDSHLLTLSSRSSFR